jgi:hypothetical protein
VVVVLKRYNLSMFTKTWSFYLSYIVTDLDIHYKSKFLQAFKSVNPLLPYPVFISSCLDEMS